MGGQIGLLTEIDSDTGGLVYHAIAAQIPLDIALKTLFHEIRVNQIPSLNPNPGRCSRDRDQSA